MRAQRLIMALAFLAAADGADAHGIAGNRFFPGTMTFDDPAVADEFVMLQSRGTHPFDGGGEFNVLDNSIAWAFARLLTPELSIGMNSGWIHRSGNGFPAQGGFDQTSVTLKGLVYKNELHEMLVSASLSWGIANSGAQGAGANKPNTVVPGLTLGKGFGDLPNELAWLRPFGVAGSVAVEIPTSPSSVNFGFDPAARQFGSMPGANVEIVHWGLAVEYSTLYLTDRFKPGQLPKAEPLHQLIPLVEFAFDSPRGKKTIATMSPGLSYVEHVWQLSAEAIVPLNSQGGRGVGVRTQLLLFLDDLARSLFGKPLLMH